MPFTEHDDVIEELTAYRADKPFDIGILPRTPVSRAHFLNAKAGSGPRGEDCQPMLTKTPPGHSLKRLKFIPDKLLLKRGLYQHSHLSGRGS